MEVLFNPKIISDDLSEYAEFYYSHILQKHYILDKYRRKYLILRIIYQQTSWDDWEACGDNIATFPVYLVVNPGDWNGETRVSLSVPVR